MFNCYFGRVFFFKGIFFHEKDAPISIDYSNIKCRPEPKFVQWETTVNSEIFARILFSRIALKDIFATFEIRE